MEIEEIIMSEMQKYMRNLFFGRYDIGPLAIIRHGLPSV